MRENERQNADMPRPRRQEPPREKNSRKGVSSPEHVRRKEPSYGSDTAEISVPREPAGSSPQSRRQEPYREQQGYRRSPGDMSYSYENEDPYERRPAVRRRDPYEASPHRRKSPPPRRRRKRKSGCLGRIVRWIIGIVVIVFLIYSAVSLLLISRVRKAEKAERSFTAGSMQAGYVRSVLLIGTDARDPSEERGRSDSMILLSVNSSAGRIYLTSFMRDCYVQIPGYGWDKLNAAYSFGGPELLMDTLEYNFDVSIDDYMSVSFSGFAGIIDAFGGVEISLSDAEAQAVNEILISEVNEIMGDDRESDLLTEGGTLLLSGKQALSYARIRYVGNADFERTSRQRAVIEQLLGRVKTQAAGAVPRLISAALPQLSTNMSTSDMYLLSLRVPVAAGYEIVQQRVPAEGTWWDDTVGDQSVLQVDFDANKTILQDTVYSSSK